MKVKCITKKHITNTAPVFFLPYDVSENEDDYVSFSNGTGVQDGTEYSVFIGAEYEVYGVMVYDNIIYYLISYEESVVPDWIPSDLFQITDPTIPCFWSIQTNYEKNDNILFILSDYEIATDLKYMIGLIRGELHDFKKFQEDMKAY